MHMETINIPATLQANDVLFETTSYSIWHLVGRVSVSMFFGRIKSNTVSIGTNYDYIAITRTIIYNSWFYAPFSAT